MDLKGLVRAIPACALGFAVNAGATSEEALRSAVDQRLSGDRTGACMAVAVVESDAVARTFRCADAKDAARIGVDSAFEIGSVSKTMTAVLLADLILQGKGSLDDRLADWLPPGTKVPQYDGRPILLRHVVTHTSGLPALPSRLHAKDMADPYAGLDASALLASLADAKLDAAPGTRFEYSNFASMVLSYAVARKAGSDLETLLKRRLFAPLAMDKAYVSAKPDGVRVATGHSQNGTAVPAWTFATDLAGVGGVHATLEDMIRYVQASLDLSESAISPALELSRKKVSEQPAMAMNWMLVPLAGRTLHLHEGGTGGFSSFVALDPANRRGVVILSDTSWNSIGGLGALGLHLVEPSLPLGKPRHDVPAPKPLLEALAGRYRLPSLPPMTLRQRDGKLFVQADGQSEFELAHDDAGDFRPLAFDALLRPQKKADGSQFFVWTQMGASVPAARMEEGGKSKSPAPSIAELQAYAGEYPLMPGFALSVRARDGGLHAQATGQGEFALEATGKDRFEAAAYGIEIVFARAADGKVASLDLHQAGRVLHGERRVPDTEAR